MIMKLIFSLVPVLSLICAGSCSKHVEKICAECSKDKNNMDYISSHEVDRSLYKLSQDLVIYDDNGMEVARIFEGAIIRRASIFDLESGDIGDNKLYSLIINKSDDVNCENMGLISEADELGVYKTTSKKNELRADQ